MRLAENPVYAFRPDGSVFDLAAPDPSEIRFDEMANGLSKIARFNGTPPGIAYSVAQHSVMGAEAIMQEGGDELTAALFLLHDGHEYLIGDFTRPAQRLLGSVMNGFDANGADMLRHVFNAIKYHWDEAIYAAAGLPGRNRWTNRQGITVDAMDNRMLYAEIVALFGEHAKIDMPASASRRPKTRGAIAPWPAMKAEERFNEMLERLPVSRSALVAGGRG